MKENKWTCLLNIMVILYLLAIFSDLFSQENYKVNPYIGDDIATLIIVWLIPVAVFFLSLRDQNIKEKLLSNKKILVTFVLIFLAGISHKILLIIYGSIIPVDMINSFISESSTERNIFIILQTITLVIKFLGFARALQLGIKQINIPKHQNRRRFILMLIMIISFFAYLILDIKALLSSYGY